MRFGYVTFCARLSLFLGLFVSCNGLFRDDPPQNDEEGEGGEIENLIGSGSELTFRGLDMNRSHPKVFRVTVGEKDKEGTQTYRVTVESPDKGTQSVHMLKGTQEIDDKSQKRSYDAYDASGKEYVGFYLIEEEVLTAQLNLGETKALYLARRKEDVSFNGQYVSLTILESDSAAFNLGFDFLRIDRETLYSYSGKEDPFAIPYTDIYKKSNMTPRMKFASKKEGQRTDLTLTYDIELNKSLKREAFGLLEELLFGEGSPILEFAENPSRFFAKEGELDEYYRASPPVAWLQADDRLGTFLNMKIAELKERLRQPDVYSLVEIIDLYRYSGDGSGLEDEMLSALYFSSHSSAEILKLSLKALGERLHYLRNQAGPWSIQGFVAMEGLFVIPPQPQDGVSVGEYKMFLIKVSGELSLADGEYVVSNSDLFSDERLELSVAGEKLSAKVMPDGYNFFSSAPTRDTQGSDLMPASLRFFRAKGITVALFSLTDNTLMMLVETEKTNENGEKETRYSYGVGVRKH